jgi:hypothetical protein
MHCEQLSGWGAKVIVEASIIRGLFIPEFSPFVSFDVHGRLIIEGDQKMTIQNIEPTGISSQAWPRGEKRSKLNRIIIFQVRVLLTNRTAWTVSPP